MTKVTIDNGSGEADLPAAMSPRTSSATDSLGRLIAVKKLSALDRMRIAMILGAESSANNSVMIYANLAYSVTHISGDESLKPNSMREIQALVGRLDEEGLAAIAEAWQAAGWLGDGDGPGAEAEHRDAVKNSSGTPVSEPEPGL